MYGGGFALRSVSPRSLVGTRGVARRTPTRAFLLSLISKVFWEELGEEFIDLIHLDDCDEYLRSVVCTLSYEIINLCNNHG